MPEGDTIHKIANYLAPRLEGRRIDELEAKHCDLAGRCTGRVIDAVAARGKHLFFGLDNGLAIRSHLGMHGSWHRYPPGSEWQKPAHRASIRLRVGGDDYVCFNAKEVELIETPSVRRAVVNSRLGPDLIADPVDPAGLVHRARDILDADDLLADVLLDQRVSAGIGNVYKSEVLFIEALPPDLRLEQVSDTALERCFATAADRLRRNLGGGRRVTRLERDGAGRLWVYNRRGKPCLKCETPIASRRLGRHHRSTFWCPSCQSPARSPE